MSDKSTLIARLRKLRPLIGNTPVIELAHEKIQLFAKLEYLNMMGSIKDRVAYFIIEQALKRGEIHSGTTVIESSSGNFAVALAAICNTLGIRFIAIVDPHVSTLNKSLLEVLKAEVICVAETDRNQNYLAARLRKAEELEKSIENSYWPKQYENEDHTLCHYLGLGPEICRQMVTLDYAFLPVSSGGALSGVSKRLKEHYPKITIVAVDVEGSVALGGEPKRRLIPGMGTNRKELPLLKQAKFDKTMIMPEKRTIEACHELLREYSLLCGGATGTVYAAITQYFQENQPVNKPKVIFLCSDHGRCYLDTVYNPKWVSEHFS
ncbi:MAG: 2,3-diaminopropionate biosynthesis protein SbnA [bacterium]|nr:2,3-diaminopropionate biosynthesis protein SbnA [bacterium]